MTELPTQPPAIEGPDDGTPARVVIDIGSTVVKVARLDGRGRLIGQDFHDRDFEAGIARQVEVLLAASPTLVAPEVCSSANGGLRVGIVCLTALFSGAVLRNQALLAGANPVFVQTLGEADGDLRPVDVLLVGGGVDTVDAGPVRERLATFDAGRYRYATLMFAGNRHLAAEFGARWPAAVIVDNPMAGDLRGRTPSVWRALRDAYLTDLVHKEGVRALRHRITRPIRPTPEVVGLGFRRAVSGCSEIAAAGPCVLLDIGGATTDLHYTVEIIRRDSDSRPPAGSSIGRYVFTDLGVFASRDSTLLRLRSHPRSFELLSRVLGEGVREAYGHLREGEFDPSAELMAAACLFLALDRFFHADEAGLPSADAERISQVLVTGGGGMLLGRDIVDHVLGAFYDGAAGRPAIFVDRDYRIWVDGITWDTTAGTEAAALPVALAAPGAS